MKSGPMSGLVLVLSLGILSGCMAEDEPHLGKGIRILRNEYPLWLERISMKYAFLLSVIADKPLEEVVIRFSTLGRVMNELNINDEMRGMLNNATPGIKIDRWEGTVEWEDMIFDVFMYDFTELVRAANPEADYNVTTTYVWMSQTNGSLSYWYRGISDYFFDRGRTMVDLTITHNDRSDYYRQEAGYQDIMEAPAFGEITFRNVELDDRLFVIFMLDGATIPDHNGLLQVIRIYEDSSLETVMTNFMGPSMPEPILLPFLSLILLPTLQHLHKRST